MQKIMIVSVVNTEAERIKEYAAEMKCKSVLCVSDAAKAEESAKENNYDVVAVVAPLEGEFGIRLAREVSTETNSGVILIVDEDKLEKAYSKIENERVFLVSKPVSKAEFYQAVKFLNATDFNLFNLNKQNLKLHGQLEELRLINRAKCVLIEHLNMSEQQAHKYIERQAMNMRTTRGEIAKSILRTYEMR